MPDQVPGGPGRRRDRAPHDPQQAVDVTEAEGVPHLVNRGAFENEVRSAISKKSSCNAACRVCRRPVRARFQATVPGEPARFTHRIRLAKPKTPMVMGLHTSAVARPGSIATFARLNGCTGRMSS